MARSVGTVRIDTETCKGCELCIPPCPVDCISLIPAGALPDPDLSRARHDWRAVRLVRDTAERAARLSRTNRPRQAWGLLRQSSRRDAGS
jgi:electron transport complex protein RnfB